MMFNNHTSKNIFKIVFFLTFIDLLLFSINRLSIEFGLPDFENNLYFISDFSLGNYIIFILCCILVFIVTISLTFIVPKNFFRIRITINTFFLLTLILLISSIYIFYIQQNFRPRYNSGSIMTTAGLTRVFNSTLLLCLFIIYQLNREHSNYKIFILILVSSILTIDGLGGAAIFLAMILFDYFRKNSNKKIISRIFMIITTLFVLDFALSFKYSFGNKSGDVDNFFLTGYAGYSGYIYNYIIPRISTHAEHLYSYISQDLDISNYNYLATVITESFFNRIKLIFFDGANIFYPKTVAQSIVFSTQGLYAPGGSSPGYVLSVISFFPFTLPMVILLAFFFSQVSSRLYEKINFLQVACLCWLIKGMSANLLDMIPIISNDLFTLVFAFLSSHIFIKHKKI